MLSHSTKWDELKLGDLFEKIIGGGTPSKAEPSYWRGNIPWASVKDMADGVYRVTSTIDHITELGLKNSASNLVPKGTVIISTRMGLGRCFRADMDIAINQDLKALFPNGRVIPDFLLWLMVYLGSRIERMGSGTTVKGIRLEQLKDVDVNLPPLPTQRKIAAILSAYDDLIENNTRRIKILEEMAQALYREWFVKFRFPGHEKVRMVETEIGMVPEGWEVVKVGKILKKVKRGTKIQKKDYATEGLIPIVDQGKEFLGGYTDNTKSQILDDLPLIVFGDHTRVLKFVDFPFACGADGTQLLKSNDERMPMTLFYYALMSIDLSDFAYARHFKFLKNETLFLPPKSISDIFDQFVSLLRDHIRSLMQKNTNLRRTRDLLLPKLISGEVDVENINVMMPNNGSGVA